MAATETMRTRLVMAGAFAGALMLLALSMVFSWPVAVRGSASSVADEAAAAFDSPSGTCLDWPADNPRAMRRLSCDAAHIFEVTSNVEISTDYGPEASPPDEKKWQEIANQKCTPGVATYLGGKLDPFGRYSVSALKPTDDQWRSGDRKLRCGLHRVTPAGTRLLTKGSAAKQDQSNIHDPGTCFALTDTKSVGDPIDCGKEHAIEVVGNVDLTQAFPADFPAAEAQGNKLADLCAQVAAQYTSGVNLTAKRLTLSWDTLQDQSWAAGSRRVDCKVGAALPDGSGLAPVVGSVKNAGADAGGAPPAEAPPSSSAPSSVAGG
ncbi:MAG: septum formation family protein [Labedaea sp.]